MNYKFLPVIGCFLLIACKAATPQSSKVQEGWRQHCNPAEQYCFDIPNNLDQLIGENDVAVFETPLSTEKNMEYFVQPYHSSPSPHCQRLGASTLIERKDSDILVITGRVDAVPWDQDPIPVPNCMIGDPNKG